MVRTLFNPRHGGDRSTARRRSQLTAGAAFLVAVLLLSACEWTQFGYGPGHTRFNASETTIGTANVSQLQLRWNVASDLPPGVSGEEAIEGSPVVANGFVYTGPFHPCVFGSCVIVYVRTNATTGDLSAYVGAASFSTTEPCAGPRTPAVAGDLFIAPDDFLSSTLVSDPHLPDLWGYHPALVPPVHGINAIGCSSIVVDGTTVVDRGTFNRIGDAGIVATRDLVALNAADGAERWAVDTGETESLSDAPAIYGGLVYVTVTHADKTHELKAYDEATGALRWAQPIGSLHQPVVSGGAVYASGTGGIAAFTASTGAPRWSDSNVSFPESQMAVANGIVYLSRAAAPAGVFAYNATTGAAMWSHSIPVDLTSGPAVANGVLYVGGSDAKLYALDTASGAVLASPSAHSAINSPPVVANGLVYVNSDDLTLSAFGLPPR